jgi:hypothetical protein
MNEKEKSSPNVSLGGKLNKQKGETSPDQLRYGKRDQSEGNNRK